MDRQRRLRLAQVLKSKDGASASPLPTSNASPSSPNSRPQPSTTPSTLSVQPSPNQPQHSPPPIAAMPLALAESAAPSAPLDKGKRVVEVVSDDEDSVEGQVFKQQRTQHAPQQVTSATSSSHGVESLREDPPSATSPPQPMDLERGVEAEPITVPPPSPKLPLPMQDSLRGFLGRLSPRGQAEGPQKESLYYYMGAFMSCAHSWHAQARAKAVKASSFQALEKEVASLKDEKERLATHWGRQEDAYKTSLRVAQKAKEC